MAIKSKIKLLPICVDLDGGLLRGTISLEALVLYLKFQPWHILNVITWLMKGIATCKQQLFNYINIDVKILPYNQKVIDFLKVKKSEGYEIYLISSANKKPVLKIADHLGLFDGIIASDDKVHLKGTTKSKALSQRFGTKGYIFIANQRQNLEALNQASKAYLVNVPRNFEKKITTSYEVLVGEYDPIKAALKTIRMHQWAKNGLVFLPLLASHQLTNLSLLVSSILAFASFSFLASSIYILNDILDIPSDRQHVEKRNRPIPSGMISIRLALSLSLTLLLSSILIGILFLPLQFLNVLVLYFILTSVYSFYVKSVRLVDVLFLAFLFITRVIAGYAATGLMYSNWMLAFTGFIFLSLAFVKRFAEIQNSTSEKIKGRGYTVNDKQIIAQFGITVGYLSVLVLALYIESDVVSNLYSRPYMLWGICPIVIYIISHLWMQAEHGKVLEDPVVYVLTKDYRFIVSLALAAGVMLFAL